MCSTLAFSFYVSSFIKFYIFSLDSHDLTYVQNNIDNLLPINCEKYKCSNSHLAWKKCPNICPRTKSVPRRHQGNSRDKHTLASVLKPNVIQIVSCNSNIHTISSLCDILAKLSNKRQNNFVIVQNIQFYIQLNNLLGWKFKLKYANKYKNPSISYGCCNVPQPGCIVWHT